MEVTLLMYVSSLQLLIQVVEGFATPFPSTNMLLKESGTSLVSLH